VVDIGRTCFTQLMQFDEAGSIIVPVRFYFAVPGAKIFPGPHLFASDYWESHVDCGVGPGLYWNSTRVYDKGKPPPGITGQGPPCGPLSWWTDGVPSNAPPLQLDAQGRPLCCHPQNQFTQSLAGAAGLRRFLCQPWHVFGPPTRSLTDLTAGTTWTITTNTTTNFSAHHPVTTTDICNASRNVQACSGFQTTNPLTLIFGGGHPNAACNLVNFDPLTNHGIWLVPSTAFHYAGHYFRFVNPV
jgi:hypothetical protein